MSPHKKYFIQKPGLTHCLLFIDDYCFEKSEAQDTQ